LRFQGPEKIFNHGYGQYVQTENNTAVATGGGGPRSPADIENVPIGSGPADRAAAYDFFAGDVTVPGSAGRPFPPGRRCLWQSGRKAPESQLCPRSLGPQAPLSSETTHRILRSSNRYHSQLRQEHLHRPVQGNPRNLERLQRPLQSRKMQLRELVECDDQSACSLFASRFSMACRRYSWEMLLVQSVSSFC